jgi:hypothetical protein
MRAPLPCSYQALERLAVDATGRCVVSLALCFLACYLACSIAMSRARYRFSGPLSPEVLRAITMMAVAYTSRID